MKPGQPEKREFEYIRHGTKSLIAALAVHEGEVMGKCYDRRSNQEFLDFLQELVQAYPEKDLYVIVDNLNIHKHKNVNRWLEQNPRVKFFFTPTHASWLNQIELWFSILARKVLKRGIFNSKEELVAKIMSFIRKYNETAKPFKWTYTGQPLTI
jgi:transposase